MKKNLFFAGFFSIATLFAIFKLYYRPFYQSFQMHSWSEFFTVLIIFLLYLGSLACVWWLKEESEKGGDIFSHIIGAALLISPTIIISSGSTLEEGDNTGWILVACIFIALVQQFWTNFKKSSQVQHIPSVSV